MRLFRLDLRYLCELGRLKSNRHSKLDAMGLGYDDCAKLNPRLIYAEITGYGTTGPLRNKPGYDVLVAAEGGYVALTLGGAPRWRGSSVFTGARVQSDAHHW